MSGKVTRGPFTAIKAQKTGRGRVIGRLKCVSRICGGDALVKIDGQGWLQATHKGCSGLSGRSYEASHEILSCIDDYPNNQGWARGVSKAECFEALEILREVKEPKPKAPVFQSGDKASAPEALTPPKAEEVPASEVKQLEPPVLTTPAPEGATKVKPTTKKRRSRSVSLGSKKNG